MGRARAVLTAIVGAMAVMLLVAASAGGVTVKRPAAPKRPAVKRSIRLEKLAPARVTRSALVFKLSGIRPRAIRSARLVVRRRTYRMRVRQVRQAVRKQGGTLAVQRPAAIPGPPATSAPAPAPAPAATPGPAAGFSAPAAPAAATLVIQVAGPAPTPASTPAPPPPSPTPTPDTGAIASGTQTDSACQPAWGTFAFSQRPPGCWRPYSSDSPFNRQIPANPPVVANSAAVVSRLLSFGKLQNLLAGNGGGRPLYFSQASDPLYTLHCTESWGTCPLEGLAVHVPDQAQAANSSDAHLTVIDQATGWEYDMWGVESKPAGGGVLSFRWGGKTRIDGNGLGSDAVAAEYGTAAGLLRAEELQSGHINHALFLAVNCDSGFVYPATKAGATCSDPTNAPAEGMRFQLAMSDDQIAALNVPDWKKAILRAMAHYGMIVGDTGGSWGLAQESGVVYTSFGQTDKWVSLAQQLGLPYYAPDHDYVFNLNDGVDWARYLRVVGPCVSSGTC